jgi:hypothetical protein
MASSPGRFLETRRKAVALGILCAGLFAALVIHFAAAPPDETEEARLAETKQYLRQMELYGGKANVLASEVREWFAGLWPGRGLAIPVAFLSALLALVVWIALTPLPPDS